MGDGVEGAGENRGGGEGQVNSVRGGGTDSYVVKEQELGDQGGNCEGVRGV